MAWKKARQVVFDDEQFTTHLFMRACDMNDISMAKKFIHQGLDPNCHEGDFITGLHIAADNNYYNLAKIILHLPNVNINFRNHWGCTPLYQACAKNNEAIVELLIKHRADLNIPNKNGTTPLHICVLSRYNDLVEILLSNGAEVDCENIYGKTPLYMAILDSPNEMNTDILISYGANVDINNGKTMPILVEGALVCTTIPQLETLTFFMSFDCNINIKDKHTGRTALHMVAISNYVPLAEVLISNGADYNIRDITNKTPLDIAMIHRNNNVVGFLKYIRTIQDPENISLSDEKST